MTDLHKHYDQLTEKEREFVDGVFSVAFFDAKAARIPFDGGDIAEIDVDALAKAVIDSRDDDDQPMREVLTGAEQYQNAMSYTLTEIKDGTGWPEGCRFKLIVE